MWFSMYAEEIFKIVINRGEENNEQGCKISTLHSNS